VFSNTKRGKINCKEQVKQVLLLQAKANAAQLQLKLKLIKEKQYSYKRNKIAITEELERLKDKAKLLKNVLLLEPVNYAANPTILDSRLFANLG
jgi:hypothetical protein